ncbi:hypothetical protein GFC01_06695 [Desulfofundulus thermobenzoicus]|uniref:Electron transfer flavoprotein small subunit n=1 Tax=Desulfofundulus thermobenzoicus TaxID=29376 RepID=A0A6N7IQZ0_9FIRM|nr:electron transfer flavoprotein subunit beta/FixA family protein [Desulfofundulus thermobenzoicus]MQL51959.1 hypothetical protein [Desulfofundulus thermobenzoicus]
MRLVVCIKQVPVPGDVWVDETGELQQLTGAAMINLFDSHALEAALRIKDTLGATVVALGLGGEKVRDVLRQALAMGADQAVHVTDGCGGTSGTQWAARVLAAAICHTGGADMVLTGRESTVAGSGGVGPMLAGFLDIPYVVGVRKIRVDRERVWVERTREDTVETLLAPLPVLLTVSRETGEPRSPSIKGVIRARKTPIPVLKPKETGLDPQALSAIVKNTLVGLVPAPARRRGMILQGNPEEQVDRLVDNLLGSIPAGRRAML